MPRREDQTRSQEREDYGKALCPFCGSENVSYNKIYKSYRCNRCEKSFPSPSYGSRGRPPWWQRLFRKQ